MRTPPTRTTATLVAFLATLPAGCSRVEVVLDSVQPDRTPHETYVQGLEEAGLAETALARDWLTESENVLERAVAVESPYLESGFFPADQPAAAAWRIELERGQALRVDVEAESDRSARLFLDLFRPVQASDTTVEFRRVTGADSEARSFEFQPSSHGPYVVRLQPELLRSVRFSVTIHASASLAFPVEGRDSRAIRSVFGAPREAGRRTHHGVDIFASRGTPVLAAADGRVVRVRTRGRGGRYIWMRDERGHSFYYAHLNRQLVRTGQRVERGDTIGLVGNTGNARTTPPHLHFGVYRRGEGPIDPYHFIHQLPIEPPELRVDTTWLGEWVRAGRKGSLRAAPSARSEGIRELERYTMVRVAGGADRWYRVELPDGTAGYVIGNLLEPATTPREPALDVDPGTPVLDAPAPTSVAKRFLPGATVAVLGEFGGFLYVSAAEGERGWILDGDGAARRVGSRTGS